MNSQPLTQTTPWLHHKSPIDNQLQHFMFHSPLKFQVVISGNKSFIAILSPPFWDSMSHIFQWQHKLIDWSTRARAVARVMQRRIGGEPSKHSRAWESIWSTLTLQARRASHKGKKYYRREGMKNCSPIVPTNPPPFPDFCSWQATNLPQLRGQQAVWVLSLSTKITLYNCLPRNMHDHACVQWGFT